jgi:hypothetical protein
MPPGSAGWPRKRLLAVVAACAAVVAVAVTVYATAFSGKGTNSPAGGGLTPPPIGAISSGSFPSLHHPGAHHLHLGVHAGDPTPGSSPTPGASAHHSGHPRTSSSSTPGTSSSPSPGKSPASSPTTSSAPFGTWRCSYPISIPAAGGSTSALEACIRVFDGELQIQGQLLGADVGEDEIQLALDSTNAANGALGNFTSPVCKSSTCTYTDTVHAPIGDWYVVAMVIDGGVVEGVNATSPTIDYTG